MTTDNKTTVDQDEIDQLEARLQQDPSSPEFYRLADAYTREGRFLDAIRLSKQGLKHHPEHTKGYVALGRALFGSGNLPKAVKVLWKSLDLPVTESEPFRLLGEILLWQTAATEAVTVLEKAVDLGYNEPSIRNVLHRARDAVEREKTGIVEHLQQKRRGIGNMAVAGTIGTTSHGIQGPLTAEVTRRVAFPQETEGSTTVTRVELGSPNAEGQTAEQGASFAAWAQDDSPAGDTGWNSIDNEWSHQLDAHDLPSFPDVDSDVKSGSRSVHHEALPFAPLVDPLEEGIPPLPLDAIDTGETMLPQDLEDERSATPNGDSGAPANEEFQSAKYPFAPGEDNVRTTIDHYNLPGETQPKLSDFAPGTKGGGQTDGVKLGPAHADTEPAMPAINLAEQGEDPGIATWGDYPLDHSPPPINHEPRPRISLMGATPAKNLSEGPTLFKDSSADQDGMQLLAALTGDAEGSSAELGETTSAVLRGSEHRIKSKNKRPKRDPQRKKRRGSLLVKVLLVLLLAGLGAGSVFLFRHISRKERNQDALKAAHRARVEDAMDTYQEVLAQLNHTRARGDNSKNLLAEIELLSALQWLQHGAGNPPALARGVGAKAHILARAVMALANGEQWRVRTILARFKGDPEESALEALIKAWACWLDGDRVEAFAQLARSILHRPLAAAYLLRGHLYREIGALAEAKAEYLEVLKISPRHGLANLGQAAVLLEGKANIEQLDELMARPVTSPLEKAWHKVLRNEYKLLQGNSGGKLPDLLVELNMTPPDPVLLFQAVRVLMLAGMFDAAHAMLDKLKKIRSKKDDALVLLDAELLQAQGLEAKALELIGSEPTDQHHRLSRVAALLGMGRPQEALAAMGPETEDAFRIFRLIAAAQQDPNVPLVELEAQAKEDPFVKLALATILVQRNQATRAQEVVSELMLYPRYRLRALTLRAAIYFATDNLAEALANLEEALRNSPQFMPAQELLGQIHLETGRYQEAVQVLGLVYKTGRRTIPLLAALARGRALTGDPGGTTQLIEEIKGLGALDSVVALLHGYLRIAAGKLVEGKLSAEALKDRVFLVALAQLYYRGGQADRTEQVLKRAIALDPHHPLAYLRLAQLYVEEDLKDAILYFQHAIQRSAKQVHYPPSFEVDAHLGVAAALLADRHFGAKVNEHLLAAIKIDPSSSKAYQLMGQNYLILKRWNLAQEALEKSVLLDPENATAFYLLGLSAQSKRKRALQALNRFLELEPTSTRADQARRELKKLR